MPSDDEAELLGYDEAVALLPDGDTIHTFVNPGGMLIGADRERGQVLDLLRDTERREVTGPSAQSMRHGLCAWENGRPVFIETQQPEDSRA